MLLLDRIQFGYANSGRQRFLTRFSTGLAIVLLGMVVLGADSARGGEPKPEDLKFFETKIRPLLHKQCGSCHGEEAQESGLRLDTYRGIWEGGDLGPTVVPGDVKHSLLFAAVDYKDTNLQMPPDGKLPQASIDLIREWIERGAPHPDQNGELQPIPRTGKIDLEEARKHWAFQPITHPQVPEFDQSDWDENPIDAFVYARMRSEGLQPNPPADKRTLIRRATFDLTGLPPTPEEIEEFLADDSPAAFDKVIDRLLASQQYGERWGRHWLDVARYADSNGLDENLAHLDAWKYRNYVIKSFNDDKPFDQFLIEQLAGDILYKKRRGDSTPDSDADFDLLIATGYLTLGPKVLAEQDVVKMEMDIIDEQIDAMGQAVLGLTIACARCHDHKFDPISAEDYYAIAGILKSTKTMQRYETIARYNEHIIATKQQHEAKRQNEVLRAEKKKEIQSVLDAALAELTDEDRKLPPKDAESKFSAEVQAQLKKLREEDKLLKKQTPVLPTAMGVVEGTVDDTRVHVRGSHLTLGKVVQRGVPAVLEQYGSLEIPESTSGRLQLAQWMASSSNPLTARVAVNRIWCWHFGRGIVRTVENFGKLGLPPTHPELLDWLAAEFMDDGWSIKEMHRRIMRTRTYQMSSAMNPQNAAIDPDNQYFWRSQLRRLDAEEIRDSFLAVSGRLDPSMGGPVLNLPKWKLVFNHRSKDATSYDSNRRSIYLPVIRNNLYDGFYLFDYTNPDVPTGDRGASTVAPQALFLMNSDLVLQSSMSLAKQLFKTSPDNPQERAVLLYQRALGRSPEGAEVDRLLDYTTQLESMLQADPDTKTPELTAWAVVCQSVLTSNEFLYVK